jgi:hypothetical protein
MPVEGLPAGLAIVANECSAVSFCTPAITTRNVSLGALAQVWKNRVGACVGCGVVVSVGGVAVGDVGANVGNGGVGGGAGVGDGDGPVHPLLQYSQLVYSSKL